MVKRQLCPDLARLSTSPNRNSLSFVDLGVPLEVKGFLLPTRPVNKPFDSVFEVDHVEIHQQSKRASAEFQV